MPNKPRLSSLWAWLWAAVVVATAGHQLQFWRHSQLDSDVLALLPVDEHQPAVSAASQRLADANNQHIVILLGTTEWANTQAAATAVRAALALHRQQLSPAPLNAASLSAAVDFYRPWRDRLITTSQRQWLQQATPTELGDLALLKLYQLSGPKLLDWQADPLGLWPDWWAERGAESALRLRDGELWLSAAGREWLLLTYHSQHSAFAASGDQALTQALNEARTALQSQGIEAQLLAAGVPLYAEAAAAQANHEVSTIGLGSLIAVLLLVWWTFRSLRPMALVSLSLLIGCACALSVTALLFDKVHLLTLVFGASLVGVAEDYGFHYFAARQGRPASQGAQVLRSLLPGLSLALVTSSLAYLALGIAPFPGLQQMAVFSAVGLTAAFLTVVCWFPALDAGRLTTTAFAARVAKSLHTWPHWRSNRAGWLSLLALLVVSLSGLLQLRAQDDIRQLYSAPPGLLDQQTQLNQLLQLPSPAQFFLVEGETAEQVLQREVALKERLQTLIAQGELQGFRALSDWLPAVQQQEEAAALTKTAESLSLQRVAQVVGEVPARATFAAQSLDLQSWLDSPAADSIRGQWLGNYAGHDYSLVLLRGLNPAQLDKLAAIGKELNGVDWVDRTARISSLMGRYRLIMSGLLVAGYLAVLLALLWRFRQHAWRALLPTVLGSALTLGLFGWVGEPVQLFTVLALLLLLGMGVDYGIFLLEHPGDGTAWLAVALAGLSTLLSFGLLALSATPALRAFGLTMLVGEIIIWLLTPWLRRADSVASLSHSLHQDIESCGKNTQKF